MASVLEIHSNASPAPERVGRQNIFWNNFSFLAYAAGISLDLLLSACTRLSKRVTRDNGPWTGQWKTFISLAVLVCLVEPF